MKKILEIYKTAKAPVYSFEFFPPKTPEGETKLFEAVEELSKVDPGYITVTYGAGGSTRDKTIRITSELAKKFSLPAAAHFTCVGGNKDEIRVILKQIRESGIENLMALRGDPPKGEGTFKKVEGGFGYASELISFIKQEGFDFCMGAACYPEKHPEAPSLESDVDNLKRKVDSGASYLVSQLFFKNSNFESFLDLIRKKGINVPVIPGIMPITSFAQIERFRSMAACEFPEKLVSDLEEVKDIPEEFYKRSIQFSVGQCRELVKLGAPGIHLYTLNQSPASLDIVRELKN
ncbi:MULTISPECIES: methylenetetrahydrofolate reductase [NAD(P)H] [unclassified Leptospira]|uniref:methylenetetrahydrofolate reductase [NAD(P)H] n=1 Tax=unclassified Leptospira TaxID=2633828 RepID=UPI0002BDD86C|nr:MULTISPECIES: methylenetetrahydrofolate reductase [NAD(P)H] [unclassified Leptospira]EMJ99459.1 methylenetetrahydrofolate reductase (NAD(P)H) [Leptospira sp. B5-022]MCR1792460.1 methylenetetrahydrofolate reductase [NAD(P)H] [Leptospira sp. id769339]